MAISTWSPLGEWSLGVASSNWNLLGKSIGNVLRGRGPGVASSTRTLFGQWSCGGQLLAGSAWAVAFGIAKLTGETGTLELPIPFGTLLGSVPGLGTSIGNSPGLWGGPWSGQIHWESNPGVASSMGSLLAQWSCGGQFPRGLAWAMALAWRALLTGETGTLELSIPFGIPLGQCPWSGRFQW